MTDNHTLPAPSGATVAWEVTWRDGSGSLYWTEDEADDAIAAAPVGEGIKYALTRHPAHAPAAASPKPYPIMDHAAHSQALWEEFFDKANGVLDGDKLLREVAALRAGRHIAASPEPGAVESLLDRLEEHLDTLEVREITEHNAVLGVGCTEAWVMMPSVYDFLRKERENLAAAPRASGVQGAVDWYIALRDAFYNAHVAGQRVHDLRVDTSAALAYASGAVEFVKIGKEIAAPRADATAGGVTEAMVEAAWNVLYPPRVRRFVNGPASNKVRDAITAALRAAQADGGTRG